MKQRERGREAGMDRETERESELIWSAFGVLFDHVK